MQRVIVLGAGGFIGGHMVQHLKQAGCWVRGVDIKPQPYPLSAPDEFVLGDLRKPDFCAQVLDHAVDAVYQFAADMGGAGYLFTGAHDADVMHNSALINLNLF